MLSSKARRGLVVALGYREDMASEFDTALFSKRPISAELKLNIIDAMARKPEALEVINCLETTGTVPLSARARRRLLVMLAGSGNDSTRAAIAEILPLMLGGPVITPSLLLTASTYAILAASTITNTGSSVINGDVGLYPGSSITGGAWTVNGTIHSADAAAQQAQADALALYTTLASQPATTIPSALDSQILTAGYYEFASGAATLASSGDGTLTFDGPGLFVIKTASTLGTGAGGIPTITLTNGALSSNIYWIVGSSATVNIGVTAAGATFRGTVIADASATATQSGIIDGRLIALNAAVTLSAANTITVPA